MKSGLLSLLLVDFYSFSCGGRGGYFYIDQFLGRNSAAASWELSASVPGRFQHPLLAYCSWGISTSGPWGFFLHLLWGGTYFCTCLWEISTSVSRRLSTAACLKGLLQLLLGNFYSRSSGIFSTSAPGCTSFLHMLLGDLYICFWADFYGYFFERISIASLGEFLQPIHRDFIYICSRRYIFLHLLLGDFYICSWADFCSCFFLNDFYSCSWGISTSAIGGTYFCSCLWAISPSVPGRISTAAFERIFTAAPGEFYSCSWEISTAAPGGFYIGSGRYIFL
jgi:hypothetical protein